MFKVYHKLKYVKRVYYGHKRIKCVFGLLNLTVSLSNVTSLINFSLACLGPVKNRTPVPFLTAPTNRDRPWKSPGTIYPSSYTLTDSPFPLSSTNVYKSSVICPPTEMWRVPDPYDCSIYHDCFRGTDLISYCPAQLQYNSETRNCDRPQNVHCMNYLL